MLDFFREVWLIDFEFSAPDGERPTPVCLVAREFKSNRLIRLFADELGNRPPFDVGPDVLIVAFFASAEVGCFLALGWPVPVRILDLWTEQRCLTNGTGAKRVNLLSTLGYYGLDSIAAAEKDELRQLAMRGGPYTAAERLALLDYCQSDVDALARLLPLMLRSIDGPRALLRGRYMAAVGRMEYNGVPIDVEALALFRETWEPIKSQLIADVDREYGVFVPTGQRELDPETEHGAAVFATAAAWELDPYELSRAVDHVWRTERDASREHNAAVSAARKRTGLTIARINRWENDGKDCSTWPGLDLTARELAGEFPALGIGGGYRHGEGFDNSDYAGALWELLRESTATAKPKHHPDIFAAAVKLIGDSPAAVPTVPLSFSAERFAAYLGERGIPWPRNETGRLALDDDTFKQQARRYPEVSALRELRHSLSGLRLENLAVGADGRNRCLLSPFGSMTGRNQPSNNRFIFGPSVWLRGLIKPADGFAVAYIDWSQQELGIAAALSGDANMLAAYRSGDPYLAFAKQAGAVTPDATKETHPDERNRFKVCSLAVQYGMGENGLAASLGGQLAMARYLLRSHRETYRVFWDWSQQQVDEGILLGSMQTVFGWTVRVGREVNPRSLANFPMQANGAEMMRLACCLATEAGIRVCAPVHDAILIEAAADEIETVVQRTQAYMAEASRIVLNGFELATDALIVTAPDRYMDDKRGRLMWERVTSLAAACIREREETFSKVEPFVR